MSVGGKTQAVAQNAVAAPGEMSLADYLALVRRRKWYVVVPVLVAVAASLAISLSTTPMYRATTKVLVEAGPEVGEVSGEEAVLNNTVSNELARAEDPALQEGAREEVGEEPELSVERAAEGDVLLFSAESRKADDAADAANAYADTYVASRQDALARDFEGQAAVLEGELADAEQRLESLDSEFGADADELRLRIAELRRQIEQGKTAANLAVERGASVISAAEVPDGPFSPRTVRSAILAGLLGLFVGLTAAFLRDQLDNNIRIPAGLERATGLPVAAVIPRLRGWKKNDTHVVVLESPKSPQAEAYRSLRARIRFRGVDMPIRSLLVTSPRPGEGKTTTSTNLAVAYATAGENTLLIDLDLHRPRVHKFFKIRNDHGMSTVLDGGDLSAAIRQLPTVPNLSVIPAGPSTDLSSEMLNSDRLEVILRSLSDRFDVIIIDTPPVLAVADPLTISRLCDGVLLVVSASGTDKRDATNAANQLAEVKAPTIGAVLNNYSASETGYSYNPAYSDYRSSGGAQADSDDASDNFGDDASDDAGDDFKDDIKGSRTSTAHKLSRRERKRLERQRELEREERELQRAEAEYESNLQADAVPQLDGNHIDDNQVDDDQVDDSQVDDSLADDTPTDHSLAGLAAPPSLTAAGGRTDLPLGDPIAEGVNHTQSIEVISDSTNAGESLPDPGHADVAAAHAVSAPVTHTAETPRVPPAPQNAPGLATDDSTDEIRVPGADVPDAEALGRLAGLDRRPTGVSAMAVQAGDTLGQGEGAIVAFDTSDPHLVASAVAEEVISVAGADDAVDGIAVVSDLDADHADDEAMTKAEFQTYLRDELARARQEHTGATPNSTKTIKVVVVADDSSKRDGAMSNPTPATKPPMTKPASTKPAATKRAASKIATGPTKVSTRKKSTTKKAATKKRSTTKKAATKKATTKKPTTKKAAAKKATTKKSTTKKAAAKKSTTKKAATKKAATKK